MARHVTASVRCAGAILAPTLDIQHISLHQDLFGHHHFEVTVPFDCVEGSQEAFFSGAPKRLLGQPLTIELTTGPYQFNPGQVYKFQGLVTNIATSQDSDHAGSITVRGFSPNYLLTDGQKRCTFVKQTLSSIFKKVLKAYPGNLLKHSIKPRHIAPLAFVAQYDETNFEFLSRLATEYGEWFYFNGETLQLGAPAAEKEENFVSDGVYNGFRFGMSLKPAKTKVYEYNYQQNENFKSTTSSQQVPGIQGHPFGSFALAQSEKLFADESHISAEMLIASASELDEEAKVLKANSAAEMITFEGHSDNPGLSIGGIIKVSGEGLGSRHITSESFGKYRILSISHQIDAEGTYSNTFTAIPHFLDVPPMRPGYTPPSGTPELAEVIDDADPARLGRLRVRYHWPVAQPADAETDWLRLLTPYSGDGKGQLFKPEVGSQVLIGYQGGLAEQPFVMGNLFHAHNKQGAKYSPAQNSLKGLQTAGGNKFVMQEQAGAQTILISNSNKKGTSILVSFQGDGSISITTNGPINLTSGDTISMEAKKNISLRAGEDVEIMAKRNVLVGTQEGSIALQAQEELLLKAVSDDLTLEAAGKKLVAKAADDVEIVASGVAKIRGSDITWSKP